MPRWPKGHITKRTCPKCGGPKDFNALACRDCATWATPAAGKTGDTHPAWKGGTRVDEDGYLKRYAPDHPWPRKGGYVLEHVRVMELQIGRRIEPGEVVHHKDHDKRNNDLDNLELTRAGEHSRHHRRLDTHLRKRGPLGRFAGKEDACEAAHRR